jgi:cation diffusion facilitator CzcD-associated flavoprotein CzcO
MIHAQAYHGTEPFKKQRVLIVGSGPSGADIALELLGHAQSPILLSIRSDIVIARRNPYGINDTIWKLVFDSLPLSKAQRKWLNDHISYQSYPNIHQLRLPLAPNREDRRGTSVPVRGVEFVQALRAGRIRPVSGLRALEGCFAQLDDGSKHEVDAVILATGYRPALQYLDIAYEADEHGWPERDTRDHPLSTALRGYPGLFLVGRDYRGWGALYNIKREAQMAAHQLCHYLRHRQTLPPRNEA